jgi:hypothetical protein
MPYRRMRNPAFRAAQHARKYDPHVAPINRLIDDLIEPGGRGWMPYVAPIYGGVNARVLSILRDPGPATQAEGGSGMLCVENDDATAERYATLLAEAGLPVSELVPWNAYPWYINRKPSASELDAGAEPLRRLIALMPRLRVVLLHGGDAQAGWRRFTRRFPGAAEGVAVVPSYHTSRQAFWHPDPAVRAARLEKLRSDLASVARILAAEHDRTT